MFFAVFCALAFIWTYFFIPETKGKSLEQMDEVFGDFSSLAEEQRRERIERGIMAQARNEEFVEPKV